MQCGNFEIIVLSVVFLHYVMSGNYTKTTCENDSGSWVMDGWCNSTFTPSTCSLIAEHGT